MNWSNGTAQDSVDRLARSLKVATRVRIPLGLLHSSWSEGSGRELDSTLPIHLTFFARVSMDKASEESLMK